MVLELVALSLLACSIASASGADVYAYVDDPMAVAGLSRAPLRQMSTGFALRRL
jgi:hypothetical protein